MQCLFQLYKFKTFTHLGIKFLYFDYLNNLNQNCWLQYHVRQMVPSLTVTRYQTKNQCIAFLIVSGFFLLVLKFLSCSPSMISKWHCLGQKYYFISRISQLIEIWTYLISFNILFTEPCCDWSLWRMLLC